MLESGAFRPQRSCSEITSHQSHLMPIQVTCPGCLKRFTVNDKFAGQSGPCPSCRKVIKIPEKSDEVVIHAPEPTGPKDSKGKSVLKPLRRSEVKLSMPVMLAAGLSTFMVFGLALGIRLTGEEPPTALLAIGSLLLAPPLAFVGYWFLRDDELEGYRGRELLTRCGICAAIFAGSWLLYAFIPTFVSGEKSLSDVSNMYMLFVIPVMIVVGTIASVLAMELEVVQGVMHYMLYFVITLILALIMGTDLSSTLSNKPGSSEIAPVKPKGAAQDQPAVNQPATNQPGTDAPAEPDRPKINILQ